MNDLLNVSVDSGKYTVILKGDGKLVVLRYGEGWMDQTGNNLILVLAQTIQALRELVAEKHPVWDTIRPTKVGWYWQQYVDDDPEIVYYSGPDGTMSKVWDLNPTRYRWAGPVQHPKYVTP